MTDKEFNIETVMFLIYLVIMITIVILIGE